MNIEKNAGRKGEWGMKEKLLKRKESRGKPKEEEK